MTIEPYNTNISLYALLCNVYTKVATDALLLTINNTIALKATQSTTDTNLETYGRTETYTTTEIMGLVQSQYTVSAPLLMGINLITGKFSICMSPQYNDSLDAKLNNTIGDVSIAIENNYGDDVAVFSNNATKNAGFKGDCYVPHSLSVLGKAGIGNTLTVNAGGYNGSIRCVPLVDAAESSLTFCKYEDMRFSSADGLWLMGQNSWLNGGYSIGTPVLGMCFNIGITGVVRILIF